MTEPAPATDHPVHDVRDREDERGRAQAIYVPYLVALFTGLPFFVGVILAYVFRGDAPAWLRTHYDKQIGLFWWFLVWQIVGWATVWIVIGVIPLLGSYIWIGVRSVQGLMRAGRAEAWK